MAMIDTAHSAPFGAHFFTRVVVEPLNRVSTWYADRVAAVQTAETLGKLSQRQLDDIGMTLADVDRVRRDAAFF